ncbi:unnamed protein product [Musa acuminata var. zebrina]
MQGLVTEDLKWGRVKETKGVQVSWSKHACDATINLEWSSWAHPPLSIAGVRSAHEVSPCGVISSVHSTAPFFYVEPKPLLTHSILSPLLPRPPPLLLIFPPH